MAHGVNSLRAKELAGGVKHEARDVGVVHGHGIAADQIDGDLDAVGGRYALTE
jgi:hypothetical protein